MAGAIDGKLPGWIVLPDLNHQSHLYRRCAVSSGGGDGAPQRSGFDRRYAGSRGWLNATRVFGERVGFHHISLLGGGRLSAGHAVQLDRIDCIGGR